MRLRVRGFTRIEAALLTMVYKNDPDQVEGEGDTEEGRRDRNMRLN